MASPVVPITAVPPHTRGWSPLAAIPAAWPSGSPAHAGMVPYSGPARTRTGRFPRTRGDGPWLCSRRSPHSPVPPHTRGWSPAPRLGLPDLPGSPAHAGMVPRQETASGPDRRFPRTRGDGPRPPDRKARRKKVPPHTRGWSPSGQSTFGGSPGSPAHAGMVPIMRTRDIHDHRFPRTRGDGPFRCDVYVYLGYGSPAHAGMVPTAVAISAPSARFPRTRGDGPTSRCFSSSKNAVPPHTRGWSRQMTTTRYFRWGSPAHAGMVPTTARRPGARERFPRTRGDGPYYGRILVECTSVPPHTRGWSHGRPQCGPQQCGSPAHAGMVPSLSLNRRTFHRFPRTRGDGPETTDLSTYAKAVPPHTRGWSPSDGRRVRLRIGSPAHAGMVPRRT